MRSRVVWLIAALLVGFLATSPGYAQVGENMLPNGGFESGEISPYFVYDFAGEAKGEVVTDCEGAFFPEGPAEGMYCLHVVVPKPESGEYDYDVGMADNSYTLKKGKRYVFSCFMKCKSGKLKVRMKPERGEEPFEAYNERVVTVNPFWQKFSVMTPIMPERVTPVAAGDFWIDDVRLYEVQDEGATYTWTGVAGDLQWESPGNWESSASIYNWPNEEFGFPRVNQDAGEIIIGNGDMVTLDTKLLIRSGAHGSDEASLIIENSSSFLLKSIGIGRGTSGAGRVEVRNGGLLDVSEFLLIADENGSVGALNVADGTLNVGETIVVGTAGVGTAVADGTLSMGDLIIGVRGVGTTEVRGGAIAIRQYLTVGGGGGTGTLIVKGGTIDVGKVIFADGFESYAAVEIDGGVVNVRDATSLNLNGDIGSRANFTLNGGTWNSGGGLFVGNTLYGGDASLTINGGTMVSSGNLVVGNTGSGESRIILNGGLLQAGDLIIDTSTDSLIVYHGGELWINRFALDKTAMQDLITAGLIDAAADYEITTIGDYTVLRCSGM